MQDNAYAMILRISSLRVKHVADVMYTNIQSTWRYDTMPTKRGAVGLIALLLLVGTIALNAQSVVGVQSPWNVIGSGGSIGSSASNTQLSSTAGQAAIGPMSNAAVRVHLGFWYPSTTMGPSSVRQESNSGGVTAFELKQNYPNPFRSQTTIGFFVPGKSRVRVKVYDLRGELVKVLADEVYEAGSNEVTWDGLNAENMPVSSGDYVCEMEATTYDGASTGAGTVFRKQQIMHLLK
jgi:hypothetical protein